jgi:hypothetical protein
VFSIVTNAWKRWKYNGWGMLPIIENAMRDGNTMDGKCSPFPLLISIPKAT